MTLTEWRKNGNGNLILGEETDFEDFAQSKNLRVGPFFLLNVFIYIVKTAGMILKKESVSPFFQ